MQRPSWILSRNPCSVSSEFNRASKFAVRGKGACSCVSLGNVLRPLRRMDNKRHHKHTRNRKLLHFLADRRDVSSFTDLGLCNLACMVTHTHARTRTHICKITHMHDRVAMTAGTLIRWSFVWDQKHHIELFFMSDMYWLSQQRLFCTTVTAHTNHFIITSFTYIEGRITNKTQDLG